MQNDNPITRLLYAILSQKCLKDNNNSFSAICTMLSIFMNPELIPSHLQINWDKVAHHPLLEPEDDKEKKINGHAARMRYSRFKKQMDAACGDIPPPTPRKPRKSRVEKTKSPKKEKRAPDEIKREYESQRERNGEGRVKSEFVDGREGTGESLDMGSINSSAVQLAQRDLASGLGFDRGMSHTGQNVRHPNTLHFPDLDPIQIKPERKPSANILQSGGLYAHSQPQSHSHSNSPLRGFHPDFHSASHVTSSVSNSTLPNTPRMCIEEQEYSPAHSPSSHYAHPSHIHTHPGPSHRNTYDPRTEENFTEDMEVDLDEMMHSFEMPSQNGHDGHELYTSMMNDSAFAFGMGSPGLGLGMGMGGDSFDEFWSQDNGHGEGGGVRDEVVETVSVKKEARWEEGYRRV
ncbi:uncharacterized protein RAG0_14060 [Rhynchosporium agropyri]|uniref:Uncharacterized protein n=1 Tax=Rhynchosporium agropyri TaxID=914238 RepID=A0A1E1LHL5_9HELO|nr:uncharacterized protein RAG0_14060 [Rhynchosporium agropyri]